MKHNQPGGRDVNEVAASVVRRATERPAPVVTDLESAWATWSQQLQRVDERTTTLLRAAFEAGHDAGRNALGRMGASKGGAARAASLSKKRRAEIARKAATTRWSARTDQDMR